RLTGWALRNSDEIDPTAFAAYLQRDLGSYLKILSSVNFLCGFLFMLGPYLLGSGGGHVRAAILAILVLRQGLSALAATLNEAVRFSRARQKVTALVSREFQLEREGTPEDRSLRHLFAKHVREQRAKLELNLASSRAELQSS